MTINIKDGGFSGRQGMNGSKAIGVTLDKASEYKRESKCEEENRLQATGYETTLEPSPLPARIIPFPGVTLVAPDDDFQTQLDGFLREIGYIE
jgi:hypothetical protein